MREPSLNFSKGVGCRITIAGLLLATMFFVAEQRAVAARSAQEEVSKDFQKTLTLGAGQPVRVEQPHLERRQRLDHRQDLLQVLVDASHGWEGSHSRSQASSGGPRSSRSLARRTTVFR